MFKLRSTLGDKLKAKAEQVAIAGKIKAVVHLPDEMAWWYYHEVGTMDSYPIESSKGGIALPPSALHPEGLAVPYVGTPEGAVIKYTENHPKIEALHYVRGCWDDIMLGAQTELVTKFVEGEFDAEAAHTALIETVMPEAIHIIAGAMDDALSKWKSSPNPGAKLKGQSPGEVYMEAATVVDKTE